MIKNYLDKWVMDSDNLEKWESNFTASERHILINQLVGKAMRYVMSADMDRMRVGCFERTGCLITMLATKELDAKIKPQGMAPGSFVVPREQVNDGEARNNNQVEYEGQHEEEAALEEEMRNIEEQEEEDMEEEDLHE